MGSMIMLSRAARGDDPPRAAASFQPGDLVHHKRYGYRGVVVAVDPNCRADDAWYQANQTQPDRDQPWYHVFVHEDGVVREVKVTIGLSDDTYQEITDGLSEDDVVIIGPDRVLRDLEDGDNVTDSILE